jgi:serine/threonine protein kinase/TfoX/Sxy family transcriptional regulator of competence genes
MIQYPTMIGRYKVLGELGRGSMGIVYLAEDPALKREVAIKLVHRGTIAQEDVLARFRQEAEISARLNHPNVIMVFDVGEEQDFGPFMAMEFADGEVLSDVLARGPMGLESAALILIQGFHALRAAHSLGIIHRDFKPENLILTRNGRVKLMDFGIAKHEDPQLTGSGVLCTPSFAAPEILDRKPPSPGSDNWAFCVTACLMLTGALPFHTGSISSLLYAIAHEPPDFPEGTSPALQALFLKALAKDPADRYADLHSFMVELLGALPLEAEVLSRCLTLLETSDTLAERTTNQLLRARSGGPWRWLKSSRIWWVAASTAALVFLGVWLTGYLTPRRLTLTSYPPQVQVFLDDKALGTTPLLGIQIPARARLLRLEQPGYVTLERLLLPEDQMLTLVLSAQPVAVNIRSLPAGAEVFVNNVLMGLTPMEGLKLSGDQAHRLQLRKQGYEPWVMTLSPESSLPETILLKKLATPPKSFWKRIFGTK